MIAICYLVVQGKKTHRNSTRRGVGALSVRKTRPLTDWDEIAVRLEIEILDALFEKPTLSVTARVPEDGSISPEITTEVQDNIAEIIRWELGVKVRISAIEEGDE